MVKRSGGQIISRTVEHCRSAVERMRGLLKYNVAPESHAAIFYLPYGGLFPLIHTFGMRFEIDIAYCDESKKILLLFRGIKPAKLIVPWKVLFGGARYFVEFSKSETQHLRVGDTLDWGAAS